MNDDSEKEIQINNSSMANSENDNEALKYRNRIFVISITTNTIIIILLFFAIFTPWWISRDESVKIIQYLVSESISTTSKAFANATEYLLRKYEIAGSQLKGIYADPSIASCTPDGILTFIHFGQTMNSIISPKPYRFYLSHNSTAACQLDLDQNNSKIFKLYMIIPFNQTYDQLKVFTENTDFSPEAFKPFDNKLGSFLKYIPVIGSPMRYSSNKTLFHSPYWTNDNFHFYNTLDNRTIAFVYPLLNESYPLSTTISGLEVSTVDIFNVLSRLPSSSQTSWIIVDDQNQVLIDKDLGASYPNDILSHTTVFPTVDNFQNILWKDASQYIHNFQFDSPSLITMNDTQYYLIQRKINTYDFYTTFKIFMMICYDDLLCEVFKPINYTMLVVIILATMSFFLHIYFEERNKMKRDKKLSVPYKAYSNKDESITYASDTENDNSRNDTSENNTTENNFTKSDSDNYYKIPYFNNGKIGKAILRLRELELTSPEELLMNKILDSSVNNFSKTRDRLFSVAYTSKSSEKCELCKYLKGEMYQQTKFEELTGAQPQQNFLLFQQKNPRPRFFHSLKGDADNNFRPYQFMNLQLDHNITQNLLDEGFQDDFAENVNSSNLSLAAETNFKNDSNQKQLPFMTWNILTFNHFSSNLEGNPNENHTKYGNANNDDYLNNIENYSSDNQESNDNNIKINNNNDDDYLSQNDANDKIRKKTIYQFIQFMQDKELIFPDLDPDQIIDFALYFSKKFIKNPYKTYENVKTINYLFNTDFYLWINNKLDMFALILCVFIKDIETITDEEIIEYLNNEKSIAESVKEIDEELIENETDDNNNNDKRKINVNNFHFNTGNNNINNNDNNNNNNDDNDNNNDNNNSNNNNNNNINNLNIQFPGNSFNFNFNNYGMNNNSFNFNNNNNNNKVFFNFNNNISNDNLIDNDNSNHRLENSTDNISESHLQTDPMRKNIFDLLKMPIFDICSYTSNTHSSKSMDSSNSYNEKHQEILESDITINSSNENIYVTSNTNARYKKDIFTLNDSFSKKRRKIEFFKFIFSKFISLSQKNFNHVYITQRVSRILETCSISDQFEIFGEFENRAGSPDFCAISNSEDIDIFMRAIFCFADYSRFWCEKDVFESIFDEYNKKHFNENELSNNNFVWSFHNEIMIRIVKPLFSLLTVFCPLEDMEDKIKRVSKIIQMKIEGKPVDILPDNFIVSLADINDNDNNNNNNIESTNNESAENSNPTQNGRNQSMNQSRSYKKMLNFSGSNEYSDEDAHIDDGNGEDVDGD